MFNLWCDLWGCRDYRQSVEAIDLLGACQANVWLCNIGLITNIGLIHNIGLIPNIGLW
ncbi:hypothetical protein GFS31_15950 [Leptolyngbya sp. BL0902]|nr:hypothetical protein GFS31_15950 [Leptolyngbya sp. BL0902]